MGHQLSVLHTRYIGGGKFPSGMDFLLSMRIKSGHARARPPLTLRVYSSNSACAIVHRQSSFYRFFFTRGAPHACVRSARAAPLACLTWGAQLATLGVQYAVVAVAGVAGGHCGKCQAADGLSLQAAHCGEICVDAMCVVGLAVELRAVGSPLTGFRNDLASRMRTLSCKRMLSCESQLVIIQ